MINEQNVLPAGEQPNLRIDGRVALVTGGGSHLGFAMAYALASAGAGVWVLGRDESRLIEAVRRLEGCNPRAEHGMIVGDLTADPTFEKVADLERVDILVNDAGGAPNDGKWEDQTPDDWRFTLELNTIAVNRLCQIVAPGMAGRGWGRIINVGSIFGVVAPDPRGRAPGYEGAAYTAAKHAVSGLTRFLAGRLGTDGITVNAISPGRFPIPPGDPARAGRESVLPPQSMLDDWASATPLGRNGTAVELGGPVLFLASDASSFVTGHNLVVDGGWTAW